ncbi:MAG: hypothetical protein LBD09_06955 [Treponema sp.]|nr:hypothetical protein [Treponema sp.]
MAYEGCQSPFLGVWHHPVNSGGSRPEARGSRMSVRGSRHCPASFHFVKPPTGDNPLFVKNAPFSFKNNLFSFQNGPFSSENNPFSLENALFSFQNAVFSLENSPFSFQHLQALRRGIPQACP